MKKRHIIISILFILIVVSVSAEIMIKQEDGNRVVVTISDQRDARLEAADAFRHKRKFDEAHTVLQEILNTQGLGEETYDETKYTVGLCMLEEGRWNDSKEHFSELLVSFKGNKTKRAHVNYCIAWIEIQQGMFHDAIARLKGSLGSSDDEMSARVLLMIGRIFRSYLLDMESAKPYFKQIADEYPNEKVASHLFVSNIITKETKHEIFFPVIIAVIR